MGFIEKVVSLMNGSPEQETGSGPATPEEAAQVQPRPRTHPPMRHRKPYSSRKPTPRRN